MEKGINLQIEELKENLVKQINESNMPVVVIEMVLKELLTNATFVKQQQLEKEKQEYEQGKETTK